MNFTDSNISTLEVREKKYDVRDTKLPGWVVRVEVSGRKTFYFVYNFGGRARWYRIGPTAMGAATAKVIAKELIGVTSGRDRDPHAERATSRASATGVTFQQLQQRHVEEFAKKHNKRWDQADYLIRKYVLPKWVNIRATEITRAHVKQLFGSIAAPQVANQVKYAVSAVFKFGVDEEVVNQNPCKGVRDNPTQSRDRVLFKTEMGVFWKACESVNPVKAAALKTILLTGQRPGEVSHMRREHIRDGWWELPGQPVPELGWPGTKNASSHRVWLSYKVRELIGEGTSGFVFANERSNAVSDLGLAMREISASCNFDPTVTPHDLRRSAGTLITGRGHGREALDRILNHRKKGVTEVYDRHDYAEADKIIMEDLANAITSAVEGNRSDNVVTAKFSKVK
jgi:integrase